MNSNILGNNSENNNFQVLAGGEDAYFVICQNWLGVADGASSWSLEGTFFLYISTVQCLPLIERKELVLAYLTMAKGQLLTTKFSESILFQISNDYMILLSK